MIDDTPLRRLAAVQHGLVSVRQVVALGFAARARDRLVDGRRWDRIAPRVLRLVGSAPGPPQRAMCAVLDAGRDAALDGASAAAWWGIPGNELEPVQVVRARSLRGLGDRVGTAHQPLLLPDHHVVVLDGIPTVTPARALFAVAGSRRAGAQLEWWFERMERMVDTAWAMRLVSGASLHRVFEDLAKRGRSGTAVMRRILDARGVDYVPPASGLESRFAQILRNAGEPAFDRQVDTGDADRWIGRVDFRDPELPVVVEIQSERFHSSLVDRTLDTRRVAALEAAGFVVVELTETAVWHRPYQVVQAVRAARAHARRRLTPAA